MSFTFNQFSQEQGWNDETRLKVLQRFVDECDLNAQLDSFVQDVVSSEENAGKALEPTPLGLANAREEMDEDDELRLFEVEIGLFDLANDPRTAFDTKIVVAAGLSPNEASEKAQLFCEENVAVVKDISFTPMDTALEVSFTSYDG